MGKIMNNKGMTMPLVLIVLLFATVLSFSSLTLINSQSKFNVVEDTAKKSLEAAEAGYYEYLWYLNDDVNYYLMEDNIAGRDIEYADGLFYRLEVTPPESNDRFVNIKSIGWTAMNPEKKTIIEAKIRKKQFVHHVYVSDSDGDSIWWTSGDESHGPYHTNLNLYIQEGSSIRNETLNRNVTYPVFFDTITYSGKLTNNVKTSNYSIAFQNGAPEKIDKLEFPESNIDLKRWAEKDSMVLTGRTCINLEGKNIRIKDRYGTVEVINIANEIPNKVIYVDGNTTSSTTTANKYDLDLGNIFISGKLDEQLTIAAKNDIYITYADPTNWYDYNESDLYKQNPKPPQPPTSPPLSGGITYENITFVEKKNNDTGLYERTITGAGNAMLGLIANNDIKILHYGWLRCSNDGGKPYWNFEWTWKSDEYVYKYLDVGVYNNITIRKDSRVTTYPTLTVVSSRPGNNQLTRGYYYVLQPGCWQKNIKNDNYYDLAPKDITIHAALFSVKKGFGYEEYNKGVRKEDILLWGNISQRIRLAVGTIGSTGYNKKYNHDPRMFYDYPPHVLEPINVGWEVHDWQVTN
ncbi:MAG: hypothetical protein M0P77_02140 [Firmicutes bacterium]|nr:hypothetical protein [Bacillota bacterium]